MKLGGKRGKDPFGRISLRQERAVLEQSERKAWHGTVSASSIGPRKSKHKP